MNALYSFVSTIIFFTTVFAYNSDANFQVIERRGLIGTSNNLRPCGQYGQFNTQGNQTYFFDRCILLGNSVDQCNEAWTLFYDVLTYNQTSQFYESTPDYSAFIKYFPWKSYMIKNNLSPIFYAGTGQCPDLVHSITALPGINLITLEDQSGPYMLANAAWCEPQYFNATDGSCKNETTWGHIPNGVASPNNYQGAAFWGPASVHFGESAHGTVWALLRSYEAGGVQYEAFRGIFRYEELPTIMNQTDVTGFSVVVVTNPNQTLETCGSGSISVIQNMTKTKYGESNVKCIVDPPCVLHFICDETKFYNVSVVNKDFKCKYWSEIRHLGASTNCVCSTGDVSVNEDGSWNVGEGCPVPETGAASALSAVVALIVMLVVVLL